MSKFPRHTASHVWRDYKKYDYELNETFLRSEHPHWFTDI